MVGTRTAVLRRTLKNITLWWIDELKRMRASTRNVYNLAPRNMLKKAGKLLIMQQQW